MRHLLAEDDELIVWWATAVECESAFSRLEREGAFQPAEARLAREALVEIAGRWSEVLATPAVRMEAVGLLRRHPVRAADALQLAAARVVAQGLSSPLTMVSLDNRLREAASREGLIVRPGPAAEVSA
jgi:hypothetical protein